MKKVTNYLLTLLYFGVSFAEWGVMNNFEVRIQVPAQAGKPPVIQIGTIVDTQIVVTSASSLPVDTTLIKIWDIEFNRYEVKEVIRHYDW